MNEEEKKSSACLLQLIFPCFQFYLRIEMIAIFLEKWWILLQITYMFRFDVRFNRWNCSIYIVCSIYRCFCDVDSGLLHLYNSNYYNIYNLNYVWYQICSGWNENFRQNSNVSANLCNSSRLCGKLIYRRRWFYNKLIKINLCANSNHNFSKRVIQLGNEEIWK